MSSISSWLNKRFKTAAGRFSSSTSGAEVTPSTSSEDLLSTSNVENSCSTGAEENPTAVEDNTHTTGENPTSVDGTGENPNAADASTSSSDEGSSEQSVLAGSLLDWSFIENRESTPGLASEDELTASAGESTDDAALVGGKEKELTPERNAGEAVESAGTGVGEAEAAALELTNEGNAFPAPAAAAASAVPQLKSRDDARAVHESAKSKQTGADGISKASVSAAASASAAAEADEEAASPADSEDADNDDDDALADAALEAQMTPIYAASPKKRAPSSSADSAPLLPPNAQNVSSNQTANLQIRKPSSSPVKPWFPSPAIPSSSSSVNPSSSSPVMASPATSTVSVSSSPGESLSSQSLVNSSLAFIIASSFPSLSPSKTRPPDSSTSSSATGHTPSPRKRKSEGATTAAASGDADADSNAVNTVEVTQLEKRAKIPKTTSASIGNNTTSTASVSPADANAAVTTSTDDAPENPRAKCTWYIENLSSFEYGLMENLKTQHRAVVNLHGENAGAAKACVLHYQCQEMTRIFGEK